MPYPIVSACRGPGAGNGLARANRYNRRSRCKYCGKTTIYWKKTDQGLVLWDKEVDGVHVCSQEDILALHTEKAKINFKAQARVLVAADCVKDVNYLIDPIEQSQTVFVNLWSLWDSTDGWDELHHPDLPREPLNTLFWDIQRRLSSLGDTNFVGLDQTAVPEALVSRYCSQLVANQTPSLCEYFYFTKVSKTKVPSDLHWLPKYSLFSALVPKTAGVIFDHHSGDINHLGGLVELGFENEREYVNRSLIFNTRLMTLYHEDEGYLYLVGSGEDRRMSDTMGNTIRENLGIHSNVVYELLDMRMDDIVSYCRTSLIPFTALLGPSGGWGVVRVENDYTGPRFGGLVWSSYHQNSLPAGTYGAAVISDFDTGWRALQERSGTPDVDNFHIDFTF